MKSFFFYLLILHIFPFAVQAQNEEIRKFGDIHSVYFFGNIEAELIKSDSNYAVLSAEYLELGTVTTQLVEGELLIRNTAITNSKSLVVKFYYKSLDEIIAKAGVKLKANEVIKSPYLSLRFSKGAKAKIKVQSNIIKATVIQGSELLIRGEVDDLEVNSNTGGYFNGFGLGCKDVLLRAVAGGKIEAHVNEKFEASANTGGMIYYSGNPTSVSQKSVTGGIIEKRK